MFSRKNEDDRPNGVARIRIARPLLAVMLVMGAAGIVAGPAGAVPSQSLAFTPSLLMYPGGQVFDQPEGISCPSTTSCVVVGYQWSGDYSNVDEQPYYASGSESGGVWTWSTPTPVTLDAAHGGSFSSVSCASATSCVAVGQSTLNASSDIESFYSVATQTGGVWAWSAPVDFVPDATGEGELTSVSCATPTACVAAGQDYAGPTLADNLPIYAAGTQSGGVWTWTQSTDIAPDVNGGGALTSVSCASATSCVALGEDGDSQNTYSAGVETAGTWSWSALSPIPSDGLINPYESTLSCASATSCIAVGYATIPASGGLEEATYVTGDESGGNWTWTSFADNPASTGDTIPRAVSCANTTTCVAVGFAQSGEVYLTGDESGGNWTWSSPTSVVPDGAGNGQLYGVSCATTTMCMSYGVDGASPGQPIYAEYTDLDSQQISFTAPATGAAGESATLSATGGASGDPVVFSIDPSSGVGVCNVSGPNGATLNYTGAGTCVIDANQSGSATYAPAPSVSGTTIVAPSETLESVSCAVPGSCVAVGYDGNGQSTFTTGTEAGGVWTWSSPQELVPDATGNGYLTSVSCPSATTCVAVGYDGNGQAIYVTGSASAGAWTWTSATEVTPDSSGVGLLASVSCANTSSCVAVGSDQNGSANFSVITESGGTWSASPLLEIAGDASGGSTLLSVSCPNATMCEAVGYDSANNEIFTSAVNTGGTWSWTTSAIIAPDASGSGQLSSVSCVDATSCVAVGYDSANNEIFSSAVNTGGTWNWSTSAIIAPDASGNGELNGVSCADATSCDAAGFDPNGQEIFSQGSASGGVWTWTPSTIYAPDASGQGYLLGVSCAVSTSCVAVGYDAYSQATYAYDSPAASLTPQTITFTAPATGSYGGSATLSATGGASGNPVVFSIDATSGAGVCDVSGTNGTTLNFTGVGQCVIDADQAGGGPYAAAATVMGTTTVDKATQTITLDFTPPITAPFLAEFNLPGTGGGSGNPVGWRVSPFTLLACFIVVDPSGGYLLVINSGNEICQVTGFENGNADYYDAPDVNFTIQDTPASQSIDFNAPTTGVANSSTTLSASGGISENPVVFSIDATSGPGVCSVSGTNGTTLTYNEAGTCVIDANESGNPFVYAAPTVTGTTLVTLAPQTISFTPPSTGVYGGSTTLSAIGGASGEPVVFSIDASTIVGVCTVSGINGTTLNYTGLGTCVIDANQGGNASYGAAVTVTGSTVIGPAPQTISFSAPTSGVVGTSTTLSATGGASGEPVVFSIDSTSAAGACNVSGANGTTLNFTATGTCVIDANQAGTGGYSAAATVTGSTNVAIASQTITFGSLPTAYVGNPTITVSATASSGLAVSFTTTTPTVCSAGGTNGTTITLFGNGTCTVVASQGGNATYAAATPVSQSFSVVVLQIAPNGQAIYFGAIATKTLAQSPFAVLARATSGLAVTLTSTTPSVCTAGSVNGAGVANIYLLQVGTCTIVATQSGNATFRAATPVSQSFSVTKASQTISFAAIANKTMDQSPLTVNATASSGLTVTFSSTTPTVCTTSGANGRTITLVRPGTCTVAASQGGNATYDAAATVTHSFTVALTPQGIFLPHMRTVYLADSPLTIDIYANPSGLAITLTSLTPSVCVPDGYGAQGYPVVKLLTGTGANGRGAATCTLVATQSGNGVFAAATPLTFSFLVWAADVNSF